MPSRDSRHSDTRLPRPLGNKPASNRSVPGGVVVPPVPFDALYDKFLSNLSGVFLKLDGSNDPITGGIAVHGSADEVQFIVRPKLGQTNSWFAIQNHNGTATHLVTDSTGKTVWGTNLRSYLGNSGELWVNTEVDTGSGFFFNAAFLMDGTGTSGAPVWMALIGDSADPTPGYQNFGVFRNLVPDALNQDYAFAVFGESGAFRSHLKTDTTCVIRANGTQTNPLIEFQNNAGTTVYLKVAGDGKLQFNAGVAVNEFSNDGTLGGDSDLALPTEKAVKTYVDGQDHFANPMTAAGDIIQGAVSPAGDPEALAKGTKDQILTANDTKLEWRDPGVDVTLLFNFRHATAVNTKKRGTLTVSEDDQRLVVPSGKKFVVLYACGSFESGSGSEQTWVTKVISYNGTTDTILASGTTTSASTWFYADAMGTLASPLATYTEGEKINIGWWHHSDSSAALATASHDVKVTGKLIDA